MEEKKRNYTVEKHLDRHEKRGNVFKYPLKIEDIPKMPRFSDGDFRYHVVVNSYNKWRVLPANEAFTHKKYIRNYESIWKLIANAIFQEMEDNLDGVMLPEQLGMFYIGTPPNKDYFVLTNRENYKHIIWRNNVKYCNKDLKYYFFHSFHKRYRSAMGREDYYKTAKERIPHSRKKLK
jgi:hypothetical protein